MNQASPETRRMSFVRAHIDVGFGNTLFIRGSGAGLNWEYGLPMHCVDASTWVWASEDLAQPIEFRLLLNDTTWAIGEILSLSPGQELALTPVFPAQ
jgi:hypothetical protein